jgi:hypothetical protein
MTSKRLTTKSEAPVKISRTASVARTAHDQTHGNKLTVPECGVIEIRVKKSDEKKSKSYLPKTSIPRRKPADGGDDKFCFAPGTQWTASTWTEDTSKTDKVKVWYRLYNPYSIITEAKLELFRRFDKKAIWERKLENEDLFDGEHELGFDPSDGTAAKTKEWDGKIGPDTTDFPDGYLTTEHSPYKLRLAVKGEGICKSPVAWTYFHVLIEELKLEWGPDEAVIADPVKRKPFQDLKAAAADPTTGTDDAPAKIFLVSNLFKRSDDDMTLNNLFTLYKTAWEDGPELAVFAKVWVRDSSGAAVLAPKALGNTKFLWDWESKSKKSKNKFVATAQNYYKKAAKPKGLNCHLDRGGKRGDANKQVLSAKAGYDAADVLTDGTFPFEVKAVDDKRKWAAYSKAWRKGKLAAKTGVLFQPTRMAGDAYTLTVYAAHEIEDDKRKSRLDADADAPLKIDKALKAVSGVFQVWRKLHFRRYMTKNGATTTAFAGVQAYYEKTFVDIEDLSGGITNYPSGDWNTQMTTIYNGWNDTQKLMMDPAVDQHAAGRHGLDFRTYANFTTQIASHYAVFFSTYAGGVAQWLTDNNLDDSAKYATECEGLALGALESIFNLKLPANDGISMFQVDYSMNTNVLAALGSFTDGLAADFQAGGRHKCAFLWTAPANMYSPKQGPAATPGHEIGHLMMLPHPRYSGENDGPNKKNDYAAHDRKVKNCLMSYLAGTRELCGLCQLRLRGWDKSALRPDGKNSK